MDRCDRCEQKAINDKYMLGIDLTNVNIKLQMRVINRHIISTIMDGCNICEYESTNKCNQWTNYIIHGGMKYECN